MICDKCGKEINNGDLWEWTEHGVTTSFCSRECLIKWSQKDRLIKKVTVTYKNLDEE
jgi:hypothetical protein